MAKILRRLENEYRIIIEGTHIYCCDIEVAEELRTLGLTELDNYEFEIKKS